MFPFGRIYDCEIPTFTRSLAADEVICTISAPSDAIVMILEMWFGIVATDGLNEPNSIEVVRTSTAGTGGVAVLFQQREEGDPAFGGTGQAIDADDWSADPTVTAPLGGGTPFNLATGWNWSWTQSAPIIISPSGIVGFRIIDALSASMICHAGLTILEVGG